MTTSIVRGICHTCVHDISCALHRGGYIWDCSEFDTEAGKAPDVASAVYNIQSYHRSSSLCSRCGLKGHCQWYSEDAVTFDCEHYE